MNNSLLKVTNLKKHFPIKGGVFSKTVGYVYAVNGISFEIRHGETLGLVGESGCGKSVTSLALLGLLARAGRVVSGQATWEGHDLLQMSQGDLRRIRGKD